VNGDFQRLAKDTCDTVHIALIVHEAQGSEGSEMSKDLDNTLEDLVKYDLLYLYQLLATKLCSSQNTGQYRRICAEKDQTIECETIFNAQERYRKDFRVPRETQSSFAHILGMCPQIKFSADLQTLNLLHFGPF
jgi:hypothetical protein